MSKRKSEPIVVFRTTEGHLKKLKDWHRDHPPLGVRSHHHQARKILEDVLDGRANLVYTNPADTCKDCVRLSAVGNSHPAD